MKLIPILLLFNFACFAQSRYQIELKIANSNGKKVYITDSWGGANDRTKAVHVDSGYFINNTCIFKGVFAEAMYYSIAIDSVANFAPFIIDTGKIVIEGNANDYLWKSIKVSNSIQNHLENDAKKTIDSLEDIRGQIGDSLMKYQSSKKEIIKKYSDEMNLTDINIGNYLLSFTKFHPDCYYSFFVLNYSYTRSPSLTELAKRIFPLFSASIRNSRQGKQLYFLLFENNNSMVVGNKFPTIKSFNINKTLKEIKFNSDSVYLIDFWASWCGPCVANLPVLKEFYKKFKIKGLSIISFSVDNDYHKWLNAIKKNQITWSNYSNLNGFDDMVLRTFDIKFIPYVIIVDRQGKIVKLNPSNKEIDEYLTTL